MNLPSLTQSTFDAAVAQSALLVVEFSDEADDFAARASHVAGADSAHWGHVDTRVEAGLLATFGIGDEGALLIVRDTVVLYLEKGRHDSLRMAELIRRIRALDMAAIKAEIAEHRQAREALQMRRVCPTALRRPFEP
ncbi:MAG: hypothetical protein JSS46_06615 [Proteobacteria bacterium]|jgi:hypothetical protein|nr:hypothetical protein [Pseudomonadota bacterium]